MKIKGPIPDDLEAHFDELDEALADPDHPVDDVRARVALDEPLPIIDYGLDTHRIVDEVISVLAGRPANGLPAIPGDPEMYHRDYELVRIVRAHRTLGAGDGAPIIRHLDQSILEDRLSRFAVFRRLKYDKRKQEMVATLCGPSPKIINTVLSRGSWPHMRPLAGVTETPLLRLDGTVLAEPGYDAETGHVYLPNAEYPPVPDEPTQDEARAALELLEDLFVDFPHVNRAHRMVPIAAILTLLARPAIVGAVPAFVFDASTRGSGKSLQCDVVAAVAQGRSAARLGYPETEEELEKVLSSAALAGTRMLCLDNVNRPLGGGHLDRVITARDTVQLRVLGRTELRTLTWLAVILASGNNVMLSGDTSRRVVVSRLESPLENPEARTDYRHENLVDYALANRPKLVSAALTVLRAYTAKGCPDAGCARWGSFEAWSRLIPHAIKFAGGDDVMGAKPASDATMDDTARALIGVLVELPRLTRAPQTTKGILALLWPDGKAPEVPDQWDDLRDALETLSPPPKPRMPPDPRRLGKAFRKHVGRVVSGRRLVRHEDAKEKQARWAVETV